MFVALMAGVMLAGQPVMLTEDQAQTTTPVPKKEKKICRREEVTGSMFPKTTCHTKAEWSAIDEANRNGADRMRNDPTLPGKDV